MKSNLRCTCNLHAENRDVLTLLYGSELISNIASCSNVLFNQMRIDADSPSSQSVYVYKDLGLDPASGTNSDILEVKSLTFGFNDDVSNQRIYAMTPAVIVGLPLFDCSQYKTCNSCLESKDPFCGWCTFENK